MKKVLFALTITCLLFIIGVDIAETEPYTMYKDRTTYAESEEAAITQIIPKPEQPEAIAIPPRVPDRVSDGEKFDITMEVLAHHHAVTGISAAVFEGGEVIHTFNRGYADRARGIPASDDTIYRSASVSKMAAAMCAMILHDRGLLDTDAPVSEITGLAMDWVNQTAPNTARHLMSHTSSIIDTAAYENAWSGGAPPTAAQLLRSGVFSGDEPGTRFAYSNLASGMVAAVIESVTGERFYSFAQNELFRPLNMDAAFVRDLITAPDNIANLYQGGGFAHSPRTWGRTSALYNRIPLGQSYGLAECEMLISAPDLARLGIIMSGDGSVDGVQVLLPETVAMMNLPVIDGGVFDGRTHGLGIRLYGNAVEGRVIAGHAGMALGTVSGVFFDSSDGTGVAILTNGASGALRDNNMYALNDDIVKLVYEIFFD
jgi:CubicO group peptidase (beta-lactamase class C family)